MGGGLKQEVDRWNHGLAESPSPEILMATLHPNTTVRRNHAFNETDPFDYAPQIHSLYSLLWLHLHLSLFPLSSSCLTLSI